MNVDWGITFDVSENCQSRIFAETASIGRKRHNRDEHYTTG